MTNEEKSRELANLCMNCETRRNFQDCGFCDSPGIYKGALKMAEWKDEQFSKQNKWHKVADGDLPKDNEVYVLHTIYNGVFTGWYENGKWWKPGFSPYSDDEVIAWFETPKYHQL